jgi:uncharacterized protein (DUF736 family)
METRINTGAIFKNDKKTADNQPDYRGKVNVEGKDMEIALWLKTSDKGLKYFSASLKEPWIKPEESMPTAKITSVTNDDEDGLPF